MSRKLPECKCVACHKFNADTREIYFNFEAAITNGSLRQPTAEDRRMLRELKRELVLGDGCDLCGSEHGQRVAFVPQIIQTFLRITYLCQGCRWEINHLQRQQGWPICWSSTSDEEIKWFLLHILLQRFNIKVRSLSPAQIGKDKAFQEWLDSLPKHEEEEVQDLDIKLKPRVRARTSEPTEEISATP